MKIQIEIKPIVKRDYAAWCAAVEGGSAYVPTYQTPMKPCTLKINSLEGKTQ